MRTWKTGSARGRASFALVALLAGLAGCGSAADVGEPCDADGDCLVELSCFNRTGATPVCMAACDPATTRICDDGSVCLSAATGGGVCYLGGTVPIGTECASNPECVQGALCVDDGGGQACRQACDPANDTCPAGSSCAALTGGGGYCAPG